MQNGQKGKKDEKFSECRIKFSTEALPPCQSSHLKRRSFKYLYYFNTDIKIYNIM